MQVWTMVYEAGGVMAREKDWSRSDAGGLRRIMRPDKTIPPGFVRNGWSLLLYNERRET